MLYLLGTVSLVLLQKFPEERPIHLSLSLFFLLAGPLRFRRPSHHELNAGQHALVHYRVYAVVGKKTLVDGPLQLLKSQRQAPQRVQLSRSSVC